MKSHQKSLWPISIATFFGIAILGIAVFIAWAVRQDMDLVREDYYAEEIRFQRQLDRAERTRRLQHEAKISQVGQEVLVSIPSRKTAPTGWIEFYRPSDASLDRDVKLSLEADGTQRVNVEGFRSGLWKVRVHWTVDGEEFYADRSLILKTNKS